MRKVSSLILAGLVLIPLLANANNFKIIKLAPGWNVVSTPWALSSITYSNGWWGLSFFKLEGGQWQSVVWDTTNIKPLVGFLVNNSNSEEVIMSLHYSPQTPMWALLTNYVTKWWNLLWITSTTNPLPWGPYVDFTHNWTTNLLNKVNDNYSTYYYENTFNYNVSYPQIWEAYWSYINSNKYEYAWVNNPISDSLSCKVNYSTKKATNQDVIVFLDDCTAWETITNWSSYTFTSNWTHIFEYDDVYWNHWTLSVTVDWIDKDWVECSWVVYSPTTPTNTSVVGTLTWCNKPISWTKSHSFTENWEYTLVYKDAAWNQNETHMKVDWIDKTPATCTYNLNPSGLTYWPVTVTFDCNETMVEALSYTHTGNGWHQINLHDEAWNYTYLSYEINNIKSDLTVVDEGFDYDNTIWEDGNTIALINWYLSWVYKWWTDYYRISPYYQLHIRNAESNTQVSSIVWNLKVQDSYSYYCTWSPSWGVTDANWNADVYVDFYSCKWDDNVFWIKWLNWNSNSNITKTNIVISAYLNDSISWTYVYLDDLDENFISTENSLYDIQSWTLSSRIVTFWKTNLIITKQSTSKSIVKWSEDVLLFDWDLSTDWNEVKFSSVELRFPALLNNNVIIKLYIDDELKWTQQLANWRASYNFSDIKIHSWEHVSVKLYWTFSPSVSSVNGNTEVVLWALNENWNSVNRVDGNGNTIYNLWDSFLIYDSTAPDISLTNDNHVTESVYVQTDDVSLFRGSLVSPRENTVISSLKFETNNDVLGNNATIRVYINDVLIWEWTLDAWNLVLNNLNLETLSYKNSEVRIVWDIWCVNENIEIKPTISILWASVNWVEISSQDLPSVQGHTTKISRKSWRCWYSPR